MTSDKIQYLYNVIKHMEGMFNIVPMPTVFAFVGWAVFLVLALPLYFRPVKKSPATPATNPTKDQS
jgi:high-affinity iron transporter